MTIDRIGRGGLAVLMFHRSVGCPACRTQHNLVGDSVAGVPVHWIDSMSPEGMALAMSLGVRAVPTAFLVRARGGAAKPTGWRRSGLMGENVIAAAIEDELAMDPGAQSVPDVSGQSGQTGQAGQPEAVEIDL